MIQGKVGIALWGWPNLCDADTVYLDLYTQMIEDYIWDYAIRWSERIQLPTLTG